MEKYVSKSEDQTVEIARSLGSRFKNGGTVAFIGGLGMGKTVFTKGLAKAIGITADVTSPTFAVVNEYIGEGINLYHFDMYNIDSWESLYSTGFFDYLDTGNLLAVEWSENIENALPEKTIFVRIERGIEDEERIIYIGGEEVKNESICT